MLYATDGYKCAAAQPDKVHDGKSVSDDKTAIAAAAVAAASGPSGGDFQRRDGESKAE